MHPLTEDKMEVLSLGLGLCPKQEADTFDIIKYINLFVWKLSLKTIFHKEKAPSKRLKVLLNLKSECRELKELLEQDGDMSDCTGSPSDLINTELDLIDNIDLTEILESDTSLVPDTSHLKKKSDTFHSPPINNNAHLFLKKVS